MHESLETVAEMLQHKKTSVVGNQQVIGSHAKWPSVIGHHQLRGPTTNGHKCYNISAIEGFLAFCPMPTNLSPNNPLEYGHLTMCHAIEVYRANQPEASVLMQRLTYPTETVLSNKIARNRIVLSFKDSPRKPLGR